MGRHCLICGHLSIRDLNKELIAGGTLQSIAKKYGVAVTSLQRHRIQCLGIARASDAVNVSAKLADIRARLPKPEEIGDFYAVLRAQLADIVDDALSKGQAMIAVTAIDKIRLNLDSVSRIAGLDRRSDPANPLQVNVDLGSRCRWSDRDAMETREDDRCRVTTCFARSPDRRSISVAPDKWVERELGVTPDPWQVELLRSPPGSQVIALTGRQAGKTQTAAWALAHVAIFRKGSLSVVACPSQRQSGEAIRRVKAALLRAGALLKADNVFALETHEGSRVLALPGELAHSENRRCTVKLSWRVRFVQWKGRSVETIMQRHHIDCEDDRAPGIRHFVRQNGLKKELALLGAIRRRLPAPETLHENGPAASTLGSLKADRQTGRTSTRLDPNRSFPDDAV